MRCTVLVTFQLTLLYHKISLNLSRTPCNGSVLYQLKLLASLDTQQNTPTDPHVVVRIARGECVADLAVTAHR